MFLARILFFRLHESPRYLVHAGRHQEALESLQLISRFNGSDITIDLEDVCDRRPPEPRPPSTGSDEREPFLPPSQESRPVCETDRNAKTNGACGDQPTRDDGVKDYQSTDDSPTALESHSFVTPVEEYPPRRLSAVNIGDAPSSSRPGALHDETKRQPRISHARYPSAQSRLSRASSVASVELEMRCRSILPRWIRRPLIAWLDRVGMVLSPEWYRTTLLVWAVWFFMSLGASHAICASSASPNPRQQHTRCSTCTIQNCWRRGQGEIQPRNPYKIIYGTWSYLRWEDVRVRSYVVPIFIAGSVGLTVGRSSAHTWSKVRSDDDVRWRRRPF